MVVSTDSTGLLLILRGHSRTEKKKEPFQLPPVQQDVLRILPQRHLAKVWCHVRSRVCRKPVEAPRDMASSAEGEILGEVGAPSAEGGVAHAACGIQEVDDAEQCMKLVPEDGGEGGRCSGVEPVGG